MKYLKKQDNKKNIVSKFKILIIFNLYFIKQIHPQFSIKLKNTNL